MISVLVVDDQELIRRGLAMMLALEPDLSVVGQAANGEQAVTLARELKPDVVLMDLKMPRMSGAQATREICTTLPATRVVVLTTYDTDDWVFEAVRAGARGYLLKDARPEEIFDVVRSVHRGEAWLDPAIARKVMDEFRRQPDPSLAAQPQAAPGRPAGESLTEREAEVLALIAQGLTNKDIVARLYLTEGTVKNYVSRIMAKLHANDRAQLVVKALRGGLGKS